MDEIHRIEAEPPDGYTVHPADDTLVDEDEDDDLDAGTDGAPEAEDA